MLRKNKSVRRILKAAATAAILVTATALLCACSFFEGMFKPRASADLLPHLIAESQAEATPVRSVDALESLTFMKIDQPLSVQLDELCDILYMKRKPDFSGTDPRVKESYDAAVAINNRYIKNNFSTAERLHAIHDYLTYYVEYDKELLDLEAGGGKVDADNDSFLITGALLNKKAVCDGISKAFNLLCGIEQIPSIRITGEYTDDAGNGIKHAWNKVKFGGFWYNVDATMDVWRLKISGGDKIHKLINHGYFLVSDESIEDAACGRHIIGADQTANLPATKDYDKAKDETVKRVTTQAELNSIFSGIKEANRKTGKIELQLDFEDYEKDDLKRPDAYLKQLKEAYSKINDTDFLISDTSRPYMRYPNGVFLLMIYN